MFADDFVLGLATNAEDLFNVLQEFCIIGG